jgi:arylsulfatase A-like enzyme
VAVGLVALGQAWGAQGKGPVKVFILAGQSNMEGQAVADLDGRDYNEGKGTLTALMRDPAKAPQFKHLKDAQGKWAVRDDVWVRYKRETGPLLHGPLTLGFAVYGGPHHFGPELQFGHVMGDYLDDQVLLIKTAWGGKSLYTDFRPPSSGGETGRYYRKMLAEIREALANLKTDFPGYDGGGYELAGFVWYQGWNDGCEPETAVPEYEQNLVNLIKDVRKDLNAPGLPFIIGELTGPWVQAPGEWNTLRKAQAAAAARPEFAGNVLYVPTHDFVRKPEESPNPGHGHHEFGNAETYFLVGNALGEGMKTLLGAAPARRSEGAAPRPNIILCMTDDQGWGDVSYNGLKKIQTPTLDAMAAGGIRFNRFYAQQSCSPTRASVMTGRHPNRMGVFWPGMPLRKQEITLAQAMKTGGYATGHFGKWHLNGVAGPGKVILNSDPLSPVNEGFDESFSVSNYFETDWTFGHNGVPEKVIGDGSDAIVAQALKFIEQSAKQGKPFFACVWYGSPHVPHKPLPADLQTAGGSGYYGELVGMDRSMGTLRRGLRELGIADNTLVWYCSDNGGWLDPAHPDAHGTNAGLRGRKGDMWEGGIRVPCVIEWPARINRPFATEVPAGVIDIYPTLVDLLQLKVPNQVQPLDGISLVPLIDGQMKERPRPMGFWQYAETSPVFNSNSGPSAWNDNRYKLQKLARDKYELYDIAADLSEKTDIAAQHPEIVSRMKAELESWQQSVVRSNRGEDYKERAAAKQ